MPWSVEREQSVSTSGPPCLWMTTARMVAGRVVTTAQDDIRSLGGSQRWRGAPAGESSPELICFKDVSIDIHIAFFII